MSGLIRKKSPGEAWESVEDTGGGGGAQDLASVLAVGGDPEGNPITGAVTIDPAVSAADYASILIASVDEGQILILDAAGEMALRIRDTGAEGLSIIDTVGTSEDLLRLRSFADVDVFRVAATGAVTVTGGIIFPTSDPHIVGAWWDNAGTLTRSSG